MKRIAAIFIILFLIFINIPVVHAESPNIDAPIYILIDSNTGQVFCEKNSKVRAFPASTTKIMTAILALEKGDLNQVMTASTAAVTLEDDSANIGIMPGEKMPLINLLHALLIKSANEAANIIAENISPSRQEFIDLMNKKALELGAVNTHFVTTNGLHDVNHFSTAADMAKIARYAMTFPVFREIVQKPSYNEMPKTNLHDTWSALYSTNKLIKDKSNYESKYFTVTGIKTGYTSEAGHNLVSSAENSSGMKFIAVVFGVKSIATDNNVYTCSKKLLEYGFENFSIQKVVGSGELVKNIPVADSAKNAHLDLVTDNNLSSVLPLDNSAWNIEKNVTILSNSAKAPVEKGDVFGYIEYKRDGITLGKVNIIASASIEKSFKAKVRDFVINTLNNSLFRKILISLLATLVLFIILRIVLKKISRAVSSKRQEN